MDDDGGHRNKVPRHGRSRAYGCRRSPKAPQTCRGFPRPMGSQGARPAGQHNNGTATTPKAKPRKTTTTAPRRRPDRGPHGPHENPGTHLHLQGSVAYNKNSASLRNIITCAAFAQTRPARRMFLGATVKTLARVTMCLNAVANRDGSARICTTASRKARSRPPPPSTNHEA